MKKMVNLLPPSCQRQQILRKRVTQWSTVTSVVLLIGSFSHWHEIHEHKAEAQRLEVLAREHEPTRTMMQQLVDMRQKLVDLQQQESVARELEHQRNALVLLGVVSETAGKTNGRLRVTKLELTDFQNIGSLPGANANGGQGGALLLAGVSLDNPAVAELLDGLQDSGIFSHVEVAIKERETNNVSLREFELRCEF